MDVAVARRPARQHPRDGAHAGVHHDPARRRALQRRAAGCAPEARQPDRRAGAGDRRGGAGARASPLLPGVRLWSHADEHDQPRELREPTHRPELHRRQFARANRADDGLPGWAPPRRGDRLPRFAARPILRRRHLHRVREAVAGPEQRPVQPAVVRPTEGPVPIPGGAVLCHGDGRAYRPDRRDGMRARKQETGSGCGGGANAGIQDTMSGVYSSGTWGGTNGDCAAGLNGQTTLNKRCNVWTEAQGPYPASDLPVVPPLLSDSSIIDGKGYRCFFNPPGSTCPNTADPVPSGTNFAEYFYTNSWRIDDSRGNAGCDIAQNTTLGTTGTAADSTTELIKLQTGDTPDFGMGPVMTLPIQPSACARQGGDNSAGGCTLRIAAGQIIGMIPLPSGTAAPIRPDGEPINVYVHRLGSAPSTTPTMTTSPVDAITDKNMYYRGQIIILADNPAGTLGFAIANGLLSEPTTNQPWCSLGSYLCGYAYPANHFLAMLTTGDITTGTGGTKQILGTFFAANSALTAKFAITGGAGQTQFAGTFSAQQFDFTGASQPPKLYLAPWNLNALPQAFGAGGSSFAAIIASNWRQIQ